MSFLCNMCVLRMLLSCAFGLKIQFSSTFQVKKALKKADSKRPTFLPPCLLFRPAEKEPLIDYILAFSQVYER